MKRIWLRTWLGISIFWTACIGLSSSAKAADVSMPTKAVVTPAQALDTWTFSLTPYVWATSLNGSTTVKGRTTDVNASFIDILDHTQFPKGLFQVASFAELRNGRISFLADLAYMKLGLGAGVTRSRGVDDLNASVGASAGLTVEMFIAELAVAYELAKWTPAPGAGLETAFDLYGGARIWWQHADAQLNVSGTANILNLTLTGDRTLSATGDVSWVDPVIGARLRHRFTRDLDMIVSGDVGGFGAGSKFSWQAIGALNYKFATHNNVAWSGMIGYKALSVDYSKGSGLTHYEFDMVIHGPILGITARF